MAETTLEMDGPKLYFPSLTVLRVSSFSFVLRVLDLLVLSCLTWDKPRKTLRIYFNLQIQACYTRKLSAVVSA